MSWRRWCCLLLIACADLGNLMMARAAQIGAAGYRQQAIGAGGVVRAPGSRGPSWSDASAVSPASPSRTRPGQSQGVAARRGSRLASGPHQSTRPPCSSPSASRCSPGSFSVRRPGSAGDRQLSLRPDYREGQRVAGAPTRVRARTRGRRDSRLPCSAPRQRTGLLVRRLGSRSAARRPRIPNRASLRFPVGLRLTGAKTPPRVEFVNRDRFTTTSACSRQRRASRGSRHRRMVQRPVTPHCRGTLGLGCHIGSSHRETPGR